MTFIITEYLSQLTCGTVRLLGPSSLFGRLPLIRGVFSALLALLNAMVVKVLWVVGKLRAMNHERQRLNSSHERHGNA
jgi:hypothetical protein